jgi:hypothetical protein
MLSSMLFGTGEKNVYDGSDELYLSENSLATSFVLREMKNCSKPPSFLGIVAMTILPLLPVILDLSAGRME